MIGLVHGVCPSIPMVETNYSDIKKQCLPGLGKATWSAQANSPRQESMEEMLEEEGG